MYYGFRKRGVLRGDTAGSHIRWGLNERLGFDNVKKISTADKQDLNAVATG